MQPAATPGLATEAENTAGEPLSPELVLVSPELREVALRELTISQRLNGAKPPPDRLSAFARARAGHGDEADREDPVSEPPILQAAAAATVRAAAMAAIFVLAVAGAVFGLTIAANERGPEVMRSAKPTAVPQLVEGRGIGSAAACGGVSNEQRPGHASAQMRRAPRTSIPPRAGPPGG
jgi:hypothetical protein